MRVPTINGHKDSAFKRVEQAFRENFQDGKETGASFALYIEGRKVVDFWAGFMNFKKTKPWQEHTLANLFSATKGITAAILLRLADEGKVNLDTPVCHYWPEFSQADKSDITVRMLLNHRSGLTAVKEKLPRKAIYDWDLMTSALARQAPWWPPGEGHGYHVISYGWLVGQVIRNITGMTVGQYLREKITGPLGLDLHIGLNDKDLSRSANMISLRRPSIHKDMAALVWACLSAPHGATARAFTNPLDISVGVNSRQWKQAEIPAANGQGNARALARFYGILANGGTENQVRILSKDTLSWCIKEESSGKDRTLRIPTRFSLGFMLNQERAEANMGKGINTFGHPGAGGSLGFADPDARLGFGYVMNKMDTYILVDPRARRLIHAVYECL